MNADMKNFIPNLDEDKLEFVYNIKKDYNEGKISLEDARAKLKERITSLTAQEIAYIEQKLQMYTDDECQKEDIQAVMQIFEGLIDTSRPTLPDNHPIMCYYREIDKMEELLKAIEDLVQYPVIKNQWYEIYDKMKNWKVHLSRKQNQLYSLLEKKGFDRPTTTMWTLDDFIRDEISMSRELLDTDEDKFIEFQSTLVADIRDLNDKESQILYPTSLVMINEHEFEDMKIGDREIGFFLIDVDDDDKTKDVKSQKTENLDSFKDELQDLMRKYGYTTGNQNGEFDVATGKLTIDQINLIYKHMPVDLSYVDENEIVKFYSDTKHRVFPRSKNVIGRDVKNCHPRNSVHVVEEIIEQFRKGEQSFAEFWINKPNLFIYISYTAVRDEDGNFKGILEMMQDCTHIRSLEGSRTLLTWGEENSEIKSEDAREENKDSKQEKESKMDVNDVVINPDTKMMDLFDKFKGLKDRMEEVHPNFKMLKTPLAKVLLAKATIKDASKRTGMQVEELISKIKDVIKTL